MKTDRELLELAAKAAEIKGEWARWHQAYGDERVDPVCSVSWKLSFDRNSSTWVNTGNLDASIDNQKAKP